MRTMILSFKPEVYEKIYNGEKIFEHRKFFPNETIKAYMYVSRPISAITGIIYLGNRHLLDDWKEEFLDDTDAVMRIGNYQQNYKYAMEIFEFQETSSIPLVKLKNDMEKFIVPQMYYYLNDLPLLEYIEKNIQYKEKHLIHNFDSISSTMVCVH